MRLDPALAGPQESMGLLLLRQNKPFEAQKYLSRAVALNSTSAIANFFEGVLLLSTDDEEKTVMEAQGLLEKAVTLDPLLAPAWDTLGMLYSRNPTSFDKALDAVRQAVSAMPGDLKYQMDVADILAAERRHDDASATSAADETSSGLPVLPGTEALLYPIEDSSHVTNSFDTYHSEGVDPFARSADSYWAAAFSDNSGSPVLKRRRVGTIEAVDCSQDPAATITFRESNAVTQLHVTKMTMIEIYLESSKSPVENPACSELKEKGGSFSISRSRTKRGMVRYSPFIWSKCILLRALSELRGKL
jgi:hypothetical protein